MPTVPLNQTLIGPEAEIPWGTCEVSQAYGLVVSCRVKETADMEVFLNCRGNAREVLLRNERYEATFEVEFDESVGKQDLGDPIAFPEVGVTGRVLESELMWEREGRKMYSITATHWKDIGNSPTVTHLSETVP
jgi:hypothetical protein